MSGRHGRSAETRRWFPIVVALAAVGGFAHAQTVEHASLSRSYGLGVHAYFVGDYDRCHRDLTAAIEAGSDDPRVRYFRGLAALRLGRLDEAEADFIEGADLEASALGSWPVSRSLERVQGHDRLRLERYRAQARVAAHQRDVDAARMRYSDAMEAQDDVRRRWRPTTTPGPSSAGVRNLFEGQPDLPATPNSPPAVPAQEPLPAPRDPATPLESASEAEVPEGQLEPQPAMELPPVEEPLPPADLDPFGAGDVPPIESEGQVPDPSGS